jgi:hypothetical protein
MKNFILLFSTAGFFLLLNSCNNNPADNNGDTSNDSTVDDGNANNDRPVMNEEKCTAKSELRVNMRKLWEDHVTWTRNVILNIMDGLPGTDQAVKRLLKNQDDIGDAIKPYYGDEAGEKLTSLLYTHITQAADLLKAAKANNKTEFERLNKEWTINADDISKFLSDANPNWKYEDMQKMMHDHLKLTIDEAVARLKKDYDGDVRLMIKYTMKYWRCRICCIWALLISFPIR